jgi:hypothetical protein
MRLTHPTRLAALLAPLILTVPLAAQIEGGVRVQPRAQAPGNGSTVIIWPRTVQSLQARLDSFAVALPAEERALWNGVLLRATRAPTPPAGEVRVTPVLEIGPGGGCEDPSGVDEAASRVAIIVQGGRTAGASGIVVQGGRTPRAGIVVQGGRTPARQGADAPRPNPAGNGVVAIGPKQDDPAPPPQSLGRHLAELSSRLPAEERGVLNWLLTRAAATDAALPPGPCNPERGCRRADGLPSGAQGLDGFWWPPLPRALGIDPLAIGPKQDDPAPPPPSAQRWILRF